MSRPLQSMLVLTAAIALTILVLGKGCSGGGQAKAPSGSTAAPASGPSLGLMCSSLATRALEHYFTYSQVPIDAEIEVKQKAAADLSVAIAEAEKGCTGEGTEQDRQTFVEVRKGLQMMRDAMRKHEDGFEISEETTREISKAFARGSRTAGRS